MVAVVEVTVLKAAVDRQTKVIERQTEVLEQQLRAQEDTNRWLAHLASLQQGGH